MTIEAPTVVIVLWWIVLVLTVVLVAPVTLYLLHRAWRAARMIQRLTAETLEAGLGIAGHTAAIPALDETIALASLAVEKAGAIGEATAELERILRSRVA